MNTQLTNEIRDRIIGRALASPLLKTFNRDDILCALNSGLSLYAKYETWFADEFSFITIRRHKVSSSIAIETQLVPAFVFAHKYFGPALPSELIIKLTNEPQIHDTLFELLCLGIFHLHHKVRYEPKLGDGKVPDLMIILDGNTEVFIECKSHGFMGSEYNRIFQDVGSGLFNTIKESEMVKNAWNKEFRTEIFIDRTPTKQEIENFSRLLDAFSLEQLKESVQFGPYNVHAVKKTTPFTDGLSHMGQVTVTDKPIQINHHESAHVVVYSWRGLENKRRRSQNKLLADGRRKLRNIPEGAIGLICIQVYGFKIFVADLLEIIKQEHYRNVPVVWVNPLNESQIVWRNDQETLMRTIFQELLPNQSTN
jgi:hypothetical protein